MWLDTCNTWEEFLPKYMEMMSGFNVEEFKAEDDAAMYWKIYVAGLIRMTEN